MTYTIDNFFEIIITHSIIIIMQLIIQIKSKSLFSKFFGALLVYPF